MTSTANKPLPLSILTGFLGAGKTTVLKALLHHAAFADTAVIVNEFGDVGLDHLIVEDAAEDVILLEQGCLCCAVRADLIEALKNLFARRAKGGVPPFQRVVVETSGLADPAPILHTLMNDPTIGGRFRFDGIVCVIDAVHGRDTLDRHPEARKQAALADRIILSKTDLADDADVLAVLQELNPKAPRVRAVHGALDPNTLFDAGLFDENAKPRDVSGWLGAGHAHHSHDIHSFTLEFDRPLAWSRVASAFDLLLATRGAEILRIKGVLEIEGEDAPVVVHGVQHLFYPPTALPAWPDGMKKRSRVVFITRSVGKDVVEKLFAAVL